MSIARHRSSNHHKIMKVLAKCPEVKTLKVKRNGVLICLHDGSVFCYHPTSKAPRKLTSFLRQRTSLTEREIAKACSV